MVCALWNAAPGHWGGCAHQNVKKRRATARAQAGRGRRNGRRGRADAPEAALALSKADITLREGARIEEP